MAVDRGALRDWHRYFGLILTDYFLDSPFTVELERDLSVQQQFLDVIIARRRRGRLGERLPDGLDGLAEHNLFTFKSFHQPLDDWALKELVGHYVAYRKFVSPSPSDLLPAGQFKLFAVCARFPQGLAAQVPWQRQQDGVYDCPWGTDVIRVVVARELPQEPHNAALHLFSGLPELVAYGRAHYRPHSESAGMLLRQLIQRFQEEGFAMPYTLEDFKRDYLREQFAKLTPEERQELLQTLPPSEQQEFIQSLPPEVLQSLPLEQRLAGLSAEQIQGYLDRLTADQPAPPRKPRRKR